MQITPDRLEKSDGGDGSITDLLAHAERAGLVTGATGDPSFEDQDRRVVATARERPHGVHRAMMARRAWCFRPEPAS